MDSGNDQRRRQNDPGLDLSPLRYHGLPTFLFFEEEMFQRKRFEACLLRHFCSLTFYKIQFYLTTYDGKRQPEQWANNIGWVLNAEEIPRSAESIPLG